MRFSLRQVLAGVLHIFYVPPKPLVEVTVNGKCIKVYSFEKTHVLDAFLNVEGGPGPDAAPPVGPFAWDLEVVCDGELVFKRETRNLELDERVIDAVRDPERYSSLDELMDLIDAILDEDLDDEGRHPNQPPAAD